MKIFSIVRLSAGDVFRKTGMILGLWVFTTAYSLVLAIPPCILLNREFGHSLTEPSVGRAGFLWLADILHRFRDLLPSLPLCLAAPALLFAGFRIFISGGMLGALARKEKTSLRSFFADSGGCFLKFLGVFLISLPVMVIVFGGILRLFLIPLNAWEAGASHDSVLLAVSGLKLIVFGILFSVVRLFFDYVKVRIVLSGERSPLRAAEETFPFLLRHFFKAWFVFFFTGILFAFMSGLFLAFQRILSESGAGILPAAFIFSQLYIVAAIAFQAFVYATEIHFMRSVLKP